MPGEAAPSYVFRGSDKPLIGRTIGEMFDEIAESHPDNDALVSLHQGLRYTYRELKIEVDRAAKGLLSLGMKKGDRLAIWSTNMAEWIIAQFATAKAGIILVNINPAYRTHELEYVLKQSEAQALILMDRFRTSDYLEMFYQICPQARDARPDEIELQELPFLKTLILIKGPRQPGMHMWDEVQKMGDQVPDHVLEEAGRALDFDDPINIQYTSGTTGFPKGVVLTHHNILNNGFFIGECMKFTSKDRLCIPVPFYHCFGMVLSNMASVTHGATMVLPAEHFDPVATLTAVERERCTALHGVPTMFISELEHQDFPKFNLKSLRTGIMAGSPCPIEVMKKVSSLMNMTEVVITYGQTESSPGLTMSSTDDTLMQRVSTVGRPMPHTELKIVDPQSGKIVPRGQSGEICARGYAIMRGYYNNSEATDIAVDDAGWLHTGDLGILDQDDYCKITGRLKDMVIRGGENIYPREIEEFLYTHPDVSDVQVIGVPDARYGEELMAWVMLKKGCSATPEEIRDYCRGRIAHYKIPRYIKFVDSFPMTVTGKVQKYRMREASIKELGLQHAAGIDTA
ncbi:MAG: Acetyl-coenzyme A synthetase [Methanosaeta sp. PtaB.Bin039]|nr:MAG: Acetyl-coenzyme A synthetase [Methanosaeta sp. PtaB.Bin039]HOT06849.1 AMP-binding protein [Methanotrichaceae archaeon]HQF16745.1 AMP-binding protein [Methanotrichaceae archaeon]HQI91377.1 AMP-binding protein [Methanotrichaceae archaeon]HQJ28657.1 AMP-binding protein [Methanotrichaceae archaeon]